MDVWLNYQTSIQLSYFHKGQTAFRIHVSASDNSPQSEHIKDFSQGKKPVNLSISPFTVAT
jgi:hypothetical protein